MIKYKLICKNCDLLFDSWFASSDEFEKLKKRSFLTCNKLKSKQNDQNNMKFKKIRKKIKEYQNFIEKNFENVGANFAYEARSIHYKDKKKDKGIYGTASKEEISELKEEGINAELIPWLEDKNN